MTPFCFEHVFSAPSPSAILAAYFDADHQAEQDRAIAVSERHVIEQVDDGDSLSRVSRVVPARKLPAFLKPFSAGSLHYIETARWQRSANEISIEIRPSLLGGRAQIRASYQLEVVAPGSVRRLYAGHVSVDVALVATQVEKGIVAEFARSVPMAASCTQAWLDRHSVASLSARA